jgi:hypothetical protein
VSGAASFDKGSNVHVHTTTRETLVLHAFACNGEDVNGTDEQLMQTSESLHSDGHVHVSVHVHEIMKGVGSLTGAKYNGNYEYRFDAKKAKNTDTHEQLEFVLVGQGKVPDTHVHMDIDIRTDANGDIMTPKTVFTTTCK